MPLQNGRPLSIDYSQEHRLTAMENDVKEISVNLGKLDTHQQYMAKAIESNSLNILDKIEELSCKMTSFENRLVPVEVSTEASDLEKKESAKKTKDVKDLIKSIILPAVTAITAAAGTFLWQYFVKGG
jgi:hypothetical protein